MFRSRLELLLLAGLIALGASTDLFAALADAEKAGTPELMDQSTITFLWALGVFVVVLLVLWKFAWGPLLAALDERERKIKASLEAAERALAESRERERKFEEMMAQARRDATAAVEEGKRDAVAVRDRIVAEARKESEQMTQRAMGEIARAKENAVHDIHQLAVGLSLAIAERVIEKSLNAADHQRLIQETIQRYGEGKS